MVLFILLSWTVVGFGHQATVSFIWLSYVPIAACCYTSVDQPQIPWDLSPIESSGVDCYKSSKRRVNQGRIPLYFISSIVGA